MASKVVGCAVVAFLALSAASVGAAQEKNTQQLQELVAKFPTPAKKDGKLAEIDKEATDAALAELLKDPQGSITGLVGLLSPKGGDTQPRLALHALVMRLGESKNAAPRSLAAQALAGMLNGDRPKEIQAFFVREIQLIGDDKQAAALGKLLLDPDLAEPAAQALLAIKVGAAEQFRAALPKAAGKERMRIVHGLGAIKDKGAADLLRKILDDQDRDTRLVAAWALANLPDANAADRLLKLADAAKGYERQNATDSCLLLAGNLLALGDKAGARQIYGHLHESRTDEAERFVKEAAAKGLATAK
jgi:HEAT repeat protein